MDDLLQEFIAETRETLEALSGEIVAWEANPNDRSRLDSIFRFVHTVKGSCGFVDLPRLERLSHAAEDVLAAVRSGERVPDTALVNAVLAIVDRIGEIVEAIDAGVALDDSSEDLLISALEKDAAAATVVHGGAAQRTPTRSVRLSVDLLDRMMSGMSDMVLARNELARTMRDDAMMPQVEAALERLSTTVAEMRDTVTRTRMQRIDALFSAVPRLVRDTAAATGKAVNLKIDGADVELDREMIEMMRDPLVHMIRNSIDHGIETPAQRRAAGKRETGQLTLSARQSGNRILIDIADDGRGIDVARLVAKAVAQAPHREAEFAKATERAKLDLIFEAGLSANDTVTSLSGRGVGMDVVRANIEQIGGRIVLNNRPGHGLTVAIQVPLTLSILPAVTVTVGKDRFAIPRQAIEEIVSLAGKQTLRIDEIGGARVLTLRERRLPFVDLATLMGTRFPSDEPQMAMIVDVPDGAFALGIDAVHDTEELVVKPAAPAVMAAGFYAGQTLPDSGLPMLLLDCAGVAARAGLRFDRVVAIDEADAAQAEAAIPALLFDDLDGVRRAIVLAAIDRIEQVPAHTVRASGGRLRLTVGDRAIPLLAIAAMPAGVTCSVLRLHDDDVELGYVITEAINIVTLPAALAPAVATGLVAGVAVIDGEPVELLDPLRLYAEAAETGAASSQGAPLCLLQGSDTAWMEAFLKPVVEAAGYRVATRLTDGSVPTVVLAMEGDALVPRAGVPTVRLSRTRGQGLHRLDRIALLDALKDPAGLESAA